jgi:hypothetical protein
MSNGRGVERREATVTAFDYVASLLRSVAVALKAISWTGRDVAASVAGGPQGVALRSNGHQPEPPSAQ